MNKPVLMSIDAANQDFASYVPENQQNFCVWLNLAIGAKGVDGSHLFQVGVCTATWLYHKVSNEGVVALRHLLLVERFDREAIAAKISEILSLAERPTWQESVDYLARFFAWEFEDYQV
jgi:hypothetical protein